jgi:hypothetical protein
VAARLGRVSACAIRSRVLAAVRKELGLLESINRC